MVGAAGVDGTYIGQRQHKHHFPFLDELHAQLQEVGGAVGGAVAGEIEHGDGSGSVHRLQLGISQSDNSDSVANEYQHKHPFNASRATERSGMEQ